MSAVSYLPVQVFKIAYHHMFRTVHQHNAILQNTTYALLHPTNFCEISLSCAGLPYYEPQIQVSLQKCPWQLVTGFKAIWANLIIWGPMCSSKQILHFFLYPPTIQMKMEIFWKLCPNLKGQISRFHIRPPDLYSGVLVCCTIWLSGLQLILTMQYVIMTVVWFITQRYHLQWVRQIWLTELHIQIW